MIIIKNFGKVVFLFKIFDLTDFSFATEAVHKICETVINKVNINTTLIEMRILANEMESNIISIVKETSTKVKFFILETKNDSLVFNVYKHRQPHGSKSVTCEKCCIFLSNVEFTENTLIDTAIEVIGFKYNNIFVEENIVKRSGNLAVNHEDENCCESVQSYCEIRKILKNLNGKISMIYVV